MIKSGTKAEKKKSQVKVSGTATAKIYASPAVVLIAMNWADGANHPDFLGFSISRSPGFSPKEKDGYLFNKIGFQPTTDKSQPLPSNLAPFQKFLWWDSSVSSSDSGRKFTYTITPVRGTTPQNLVLEHAAEVSIDVTIPHVTENGISTWFNRAVVASQAFSREFPNPASDIDACMAWLANGMQDAFKTFFKGATDVEGAIYHLTDNEWAVPALKGFSGRLSMVYEDRANDKTDAPAIAILSKNAKFKGFGRTRTNIMHDKFLADQKLGRVLMGSANFTPEGMTSQANLLHVIESSQLAKLYVERAKAMQSDPPVAAIAENAAWSDSVKVGKSSLRVFFSPEPGNQRDSIDTVIKAIKAAKSSVVFCMFDPTDPDLLNALLATSDKGKLLFGLLNNISDPKNKKNDQSDSGVAPKKPSPGTQIQVTLFNRSRKDKLVLPYDYFSKGNAPAGFLPELNSVDFNSKSTLPPPKNVADKKAHAIPAVHVHHKFIVIDGDTDVPTIYTGSANLSNNSTHRNDENLLEIKGNPELARHYFAEFMRLYEHYRARALWNQGHAKGKGSAKSASGPNKKSAGFVLKLTRDEWIKGAYKKGTPEFLARTTLVKR